MQREIKPEWLLELAEELGGVSAGRGQPRNMAGESPPEYLDVVVERLRSNPGLSDVANAFVDLQQQREDADYNHLADFTRPGVLSLVHRARAAVELLDELERNDDDVLRAFLILVLLRTSMSR